MAIFYTDTGSFNRLEVTGSAIVSGSLVVSGGIAGDTSVFFNDGLIVTGSTILSGSLIVTGTTSGLTGSLFGTSSVATAVESITILQVNEAISGGDIQASTITADASVIAPIVSASMISASMISASTSVLTNTMFVNSIIVQNNIDVTNGTINAGLNNTPNPLGARVVVQDEGSGQLYITASILPSGLISSSRQFTSISAPFTGSFTGSFTGALTHFSPSTLKLTVGTTAPASPAVNDLWVDTN
jgi:hypothetical protein